MFRSPSPKDLPEPNLDSVLCLRAAALLFLPSQGLRQQQEPLAAVNQIL